jgi:hypothetical protein
VLLDAFCAQLPFRNCAAAGYPAHTLLQQHHVELPRPGQVQELRASGLVLREIGVRLRFLHSSGKLASLRTNQ